MNFYGPTIYWKANRWHWSSYGSIGSFIVGLVIFDHFYVCLTIGYRALNFILESYSWNINFKPSRRRYFGQWLHSTTHENGRGTPWSRDLNRRWQTHIDQPKWTRSIIWLFCYNTYSKNWWSKFLGLSWISLSLWIVPPTLIRHLDFCFCKPRSHD